MAIAAAGILLNACTSDPKLEDIAPDFERDANEIFTDIADSCAADPAAIEVTDDGSTAVACEAGKAKRVFHGTFPILDVGDPQDSLDGVTAGIVVAFQNDRGYELGGEYYDREDRTYTAADGDDRFTFELWTSTTPVPTLTMTGETVCAD